MKISKKKYIKIRNYIILGFLGIILIGIIFLLSSLIRPILEPVQETIQPTPVFSIVNQTNETSFGGLGKGPFGIDVIFYIFGIVGVIFFVRQFMD